MLDTEKKKRGRPKKIKAESMEILPKETTDPAFTLEVKKNKGGRVYKYQDKDNKEIQERINKYFNECDKKELPYTITGLAIALDIDRSTLLDYEHGEVNKELAITIKRAKEKVRKAIEEKLLTTKTSPVGLIFWLKNNAGWRDTQDINHSGNILLGVIQVPPKINRA